MPSADAFVEYIKTMSDVIREANPNAVVAGPSFTGLEADMFKEGRLDSVSSVGVDCRYELFDRERYAGLLNITPKTDPKYEKLTDTPTLDMTRAILLGAKDHYDVIDFHDYSNDIYFNAEVMDLFRGVLGEDLSGKKVISTENSGPWNFFPLMEGVDQPTCSESAECINGRCDVQPYSDDILSEHLVKRYVVSIDAGLDVLFWATLVEFTGLLDFNDNFARLGLVIDLDGWEGDQFKEKPSLFTFNLLATKLDGFNSVEEIQDSVYLFSFLNGDPDVVIAWSDQDRNINLKDHFSGKVSVTSSIVTLKKVNLCMR